MVARFVVFALCLFAGWLIWRALRRWLDTSRANHRVPEENAKAASQLTQQRQDSSSAGWMAASVSADRSGETNRRGEHPDSRGDSPAPESNDVGSSGDNIHDGGSGGGGSDGGSH